MTSPQPPLNHTKVYKRKGGRAKPHRAERPITLVQRRFTPGDGHLARIQARDSSCAQEIYEGLIGTTGRLV